MAEAEKERLDQLLIQHLNTNRKALELLNSPWRASLRDVSWDDVLELGEELYKQATSVGMLWTGKGPDAKALEESMETYSNLLQRFLLLSHGNMYSHGSIFGGRPTLFDEIHISVKEVVNCSFELLKESVASYGNIRKAQLSIPQIVGNVWKACSSLKETPRTIITAIDRTMTRIAGSIDNVLREIKELKPPSSGPCNKVSIPNNDTNDSDNSYKGDYGSDMSPTEMKNIELAIEVVSGILLTINETICSITSLFMNLHDESVQTLGHLESIADIFKKINSLVDNIRHNLNLPQDTYVIRISSIGMMRSVEELQDLMELVNGSSFAFNNASRGLKMSLEQFQLALRCSPSI